ncbi:MAG: zinc ribbon domain-containing protein [Gemmatimonadota bacterium]
MPVYEFSCTSCGHGFEVLVRGSDRPACPECQGRKLERRMSLPARTAGGTMRPDFSKLGPPGGAGGCGSGGCGCH